VTEAAWRRGGLLPGEGRTPAAPVTPPVHPPGTHAAMGPLMLPSP